MLANPIRSLMLSPLAILFVVASGACGSSSYVIDTAYLHQPDPRGIPARAEPSGESVFVNPQKMRLDRPWPLLVEPPQSLVRVKPRRPKGLLIGGGITFGIGIILMTAGAADLYCPPGSFCEQGLAVASILGVGSSLALIGGIPLLVAAGRWSPEVSAPSSTYDP